MSDVLTLNISVSGQTLQSSIYSMRRTFSEVMSKTNWLVSQNFYVNNASFRIFINIPFIQIISANTGGLLGLFMGFSVVSLVEILYFITLRPNFRRFYNGKHSKQSKNATQNLHTISKLISTNQSHNWPYAWSHDRSHVGTRINPTLSSHSRNDQNIHAAKFWKPTTFTHWFSCSVHNERQHQSIDEKYIALDIWMFVCFLLNHEVFT